MVASAGTFNRGRTDVKVNFFGAVATLDGLRPMLAAGTSPRAVAVSSFAVLDEVDDAIVAGCLAGDEAARARCGRGARTRRPDAGLRVLEAGARPLGPSGRPDAGVGRRRDRAEHGRARHRAHRDDRTAARRPGPVRLAARLGADAVRWRPGPRGDRAPPRRPHRPRHGGMTGQTIFVDGGGDCVRRGDDIW